MISQEQIIILSNTGTKNRTEYQWRRSGIDHLEIEKRRVRLTLGELKSPKKDPNPDPNPIRKKEALAEISDGVSDAGIVGGMVAGRAVVLRTTSGGVPLTTLELLYGLAESILGLHQAEAGFGGVAAMRQGRRWRRNRGQVGM